MAKRPTGGRTQDEANVHVLDYVGLHGDDRLGVYHDIGKKIEREVYFLTDVVAKGKIDNDPDVKDKVYNTSVALRKLKKFCSTKCEFSKFDSYFQDAENLLNDADFDTKGYKSEMEKGFSDAESEYPKLEQQINAAAKKSQSAQNTANQSQPQTQANQPQKRKNQTRANTNQPARKIRYTGVRKNIIKLYSDDRKNLGTMDENNLQSMKDYLQSYETELAEYQNVDESQISLDAHNQRSLDIKNAQRMIDEINRKIQTHNANHFSTEFAALQTNHNARIPADKPSGKKEEQALAKKITACISEVDDFDERMAETMTENEMLKTRKYRAELKEKWVHATAPSWFGKIFL